MARHLLHSLYVRYKRGNMSSSRNASALFDILIMHTGLVLHHCNRYSPIPYVRILEKKLGTVNTTPVYLNAWTFKCYDTSLFKRGVDTQMSM